MVHICCLASCGCGHSSFWEFLPLKSRVKPLVFWTLLCSVKGADVCASWCCCFFSFFTNSKYLRLYMTRLFTVHALCHFSILYLQFILKFNMVAQLLTSLAAALLVSSMLIFTNVREDFWRVVAFQMLRYRISEWSKKKHPRNGILFL